MFSNKGNLFYKSSNSPERIRAIISATLTEPFPLLKLIRCHPITEGVRLLGIPIGGKRYTDDFLDSIANTVGDFCEAISSLRCIQIGAAVPAVW